MDARKAQTFLNRAEPGFVRGVIANFLISLVLAFAFGAGAFVVL